MIMLLFTHANKFSLSCSITTFKLKCAAATPQPLTSRAMLPERISRVSKKDVLPGELGGEILIRVSVPWLTSHECMLSRRIKNAVQKVELSSGWCNNYYRGVEIAVNFLPSIVYYRLHWIVEWIIYLPSSFGLISYTVISQHFWMISINTWQSNVAILNTFLLVLLMYLFLFHSYIIYLWISFSFYQSVQTFQNYIVKNCHYSLSISLFLSQTKVKSLFVFRQGQNFAVLFFFFLLLFFGLSLSLLWEVWEESEEGWLVQVCLEEEEEKGGGKGIGREGEWKEGRREGGSEREGW